ncbi:hypothetical protein [Rhizobium sp. SG2393]|uniref:hypothetical protein n=1 Tax=Rhizobium sp. SG2393 TaxID=3276279 RepID=UPI003672FBFC
MDNGGISFVAAHYRVKSGKKVPQPTTVLDRMFYPVPFQVIVLPFEFVLEFHESVWNQNDSYFMAKTVGRSSAL